MTQQSRPRNAAKGHACDPTPLFPRKATQRQIAERAGVDRSTVSYVLSGRRSGGRISEAVAKRVREVAKRLGYAPNRQAQALVSGCTRTIGLLIHGLHEDLWTWSRIAEGAQDALIHAGYDVLLQGIAAGTPLRAQAEHMFREGRVDGVIALPFARLEDPPSDEPAGSAFPLATIDLGTGQPCPFVAMDVRPGLAGAVAHLHERGHRRLMWLTPRLGRTAPSADRLIALRTAVRDANMQVCAIPLTVASETACGNYDDNQPQVLEAIRRKLPRPLKATAVLCWNDYLAHCLCAVLRERGLRIPHDVSVIGFDDVRPMFHVPPMSTVSGAFRQLGGAAAHLVLRMARGELPPAEAREARVSVPTFFIERRSSGAAPLTGAGSRA